MINFILPDWVCGDILHSHDGESIVEFWSFKDEVGEYGLCFSGMEVNSCDASGSWLINKFKKPIKKRKSRSDKAYRVVSAIYRLMKRKRIKKNDAVELMNSRGGVPLKTARATVELWLRYPLKELYK